MALSYERRESTCAVRTRYSIIWSRSYLFRHLIYNFFSGSVTLCLLHLARNFNRLLESTRLLTPPCFDDRRRCGFSFTDHFFLGFEGTLDLMVKYFTCFQWALAVLAWEVSIFNLRAKGKLLLRIHIWFCHKVNFHTIVVGLLLPRLFFVWLRL